MRMSPLCRHCALLLALLTLFGSSAAAQTPSDAAPAGETVQARHYTMANGLPTNEGRSIVQLPDGRMLAGTEGQYSLFDGAHFQPLALDRRKAVPVESFFGTAHYFDRHGRLWIRELHHLYAFDPATHQLLDAHTLLQPLTSGLAIRNFFIDNDGNAWLFLSNNRLIFSDWQKPATQVLTVTSRSAEGITATVCDVVQAGPRHFALLSSGQMVAIAPDKHVAATTQPENPARGYVLRAYPWTETQFLLRTSAGLQRYDIATQSTETLIANPNIRAVARDKDGQLCVATWNELHLLDANLRPQRTISTLTDQQTGRNIRADWRDIATDHQGGLWTCSTTDGIAYIAPTAPIIKRHDLRDDATHEPKDLQVRGFWREGETTIAATTQGIYRLSKNLLPQPMSGIAATFPSSRIDKDNQGRLWASGTQGEILCIDLNTGTQRRYSSQNTPHLYGRITFCLPLSPEVQITCVRLNRLALLYTQTGHAELLTDHCPQILQYRNITDACATDTTIIFASQNGLFTLNTKNLRNLTAADPAATAKKVAQQFNFNPYPAIADNPWSDKINCIMRATADGTLWLGTQCGLLRYDAKTQQLNRLTTADGLPSDCILSLAETPDGNLWAATSAGIAYIPAAAKNTTGGNKTKATLRFTAADDLDPARLPERAAIVTSAGHALFAAGPECLSIQLTDIPTQQQPLRPMLMHIQQRDSTLPLLPQYRLHHTENNLTVTLSALNYAHPHHTRYRYRLLGANDQWTEQTPQDGNLTLQFSLLPPGRYTLQAQAAAWDAPYGPTLTLPIRILPPWWKTWWAYTIYIIMCIAATIWAIRRYIRAKETKLKYQAKAREQAQRDKMMDERMQYINHITEQIRTPLTILLGPIAELQQNPDTNEHTAQNIRRIAQAANRLQAKVTTLQKYPDQTPAERKFADDLRAIVEQNISNPGLTVELLCDRLAMSRTTLFRKMKAIVGTTANNYIRKIRLEKAYVSLTTADAQGQTLEAIAYDCGFASPGYFRKCFLEEYGILPSQVRKKETETADKPSTETTAEPTKNTGQATEEKTGEDT